MSKRVKSIVIGASVLALLIAALLLLNLLDKPADDTSSSSGTSSTIPLFEHEKNDVDLISITNATGSYEVKQVEENKWTIEEFSGLALDDSGLSGLASSAGTITASELVEKDAPDLAKYGLADPLADVKVTFKGDAEPVEFHIGDLAPGGTQYYFANQDSSDVYIVTSASLSGMLKAKTDFISKNVVEAVSAENPMIVEQMTVTRKDWTLPLTFTRVDSTVTGAAANAANGSGTSSAPLTADTAVYKVTSPVTADADSTTAQPVVNGLTGLTAASAVKAFPTDEDIAAAGLNDPQATVIAKVGTKTYELTIGNTLEEGGTNYYGMLQGGNVLYSFTAESLPWLTVNPFDMIVDLVVLPFIDDVERVDVMFQDKTYSFDIEGSGDDITFKSGGKALDDDRFRKFYQFLLGAPVDELNDGEAVSGEPAARITYVYKDHSKPSEVVEFYMSQEPRRMIISINGNAWFKARSAYLDTRMGQNIDNILNDRDILSDW